MPQPALPQHRIDRVFAAFERAARNGAVAPTNLELAMMLGLSSPGSIPNYVGVLEAAGLITVQRFHRARRVTIVESGLSTHVPPQLQTAGRYSDRTVKADCAQRDQALRTREAIQAVRRFTNPAQQCPFKPFLKAEADAFDDALADGASVEEAALAAGRSLLDGYRQFHRICDELGEPPRPEFAADRELPL